MIGEEYIQPEVIETPEAIESPEATEIAGGPGSKGDRRLAQIAKLLNASFPERYKGVDEKWLKDYISKSDDNARQIFLSVSSTGKAKGLPSDQAQFKAMLLDTSPDEPKPAQAETPQEQPAPQEAAQAPAETPVEQTQPVATPEQQAQVPVEQTQQKPVVPPAPKEEEPGFFEKAWQGLGMMAMPNLQIAQTAKNVWDRITGKPEVKAGKSSTKEAKMLQQYESEIKSFREIDDKKRAYDEQRKIAIAPETGFGDLGERSAAAARSIKGITEQEKAIPVSPESKKLLEEHELKRQKYNLTLKSTTPVIEKLASDAVKKNGADKFFQYNPGTGHTGYNIAEVDKVAKTIAAEMGVPTDGFAYSMIKNRIQGIADFQKNIAPELAKRKPAIEKKIAEEYGKLKTLKDSKTGKVTAANLQEDLKKDFVSKFTAAEGIKARAKAQQTALLQDINAETKNEGAPLKDAYTKEFEAIQKKAFDDPEVVEYQRGLEKQDFNRLQGMVKNGQLTVEKANEMLQNEERRKKISEQTTQFAVKKYGKEFGTAWQNYTNSVNQLNSRKQAKFIRMRDEIVASADGEIKTAFDEFKKKYKMDPALESLVQKVSTQVYEKEIDDIVGAKEAAKFKKDQANSFLSNLLDQTYSNLGSSLKNFGIIFGSDQLRGFGEIIESNYKLANYKNDSWMDLFDATKMAGNTGMLLGRMTPGIIGAAGTVMALRGAGVGKATEIMGATLASWGAETADMMGGMYDQVLAKTGDPIKAKDAVNELLAGQIFMMPTYTLEVLPFFNVMKGSTLTKALKSGSLEYFTEGVLQEFPQNAMEEVIANNDKFYNAYKAMNYEKFRETMVATAPSFFMGGAPAAFTGAREYTAKTMAEREAKSFLAKQSLLFNDVNMSQSFMDIQREKGKNFTGALVSNLFTGGKLSKEQADALAIQVDNFDKFQQMASKSKLTPLATKVGFLLLNQYENAEKEGRLEDAARYKELFNNVFQKGASPDLFAVTLLNGDEYFYTKEQAVKLFENDLFKEFIKKREIAFGGYFDNKKNPDYVEVQNLFNDALKQDLNQTPTDDRLKSRVEIATQTLEREINDLSSNPDLDKVEKEDLENYKKELALLKESPIAYFQSKQEEYQAEINKNTEKATDFQKTMLKFYSDIVNEFKTFGRRKGKAVTTKATTTAAATDVADEEVLVDDEEYSRFKNENKVDEERMLAFIDDYLNDVDFSTIPNIDQRYVEMYNHFLPEIKKRAEGLTDETEDKSVDDTIIWTDSTSGEKQEYTFGEMQELEKMFKDSYKEVNVKNLKVWFSLDDEKATQLLEAYNKAKEPKVESIPTPEVGQTVIIGGEKGTVIDEGAGKLAIETPTKTIEIPAGQTLQDLGAKLYTEPTQVQGKTAAERLKSKLQQRKDRAKKQVKVIDENTAMVNGKEFRINKDPKGNSIYLTDGKIEIRDENVLIDVDIQRHKLEVKETPEEQERQLQELYSELPPNRRTSVQAIIEKDMTDRIANLLENGITDQTDDTDFLQTRLWAEGRIAELREKESDNSYALDMIEELQNLLNTLWYEHYQKFGREPGAEGAGKVEQEDTGKKKTPGVQDTGKERRVANVGDELHDAVGEFGEGVESKMDAEKRLADGEILFGINEQDDSLTELFNEDLAAWPPDTIMAIRPEYLPGAIEEEAGKEEEAPEEEEVEETEWTRMDAALDATGKQGEKMRADLRAEIGDEKFSAMRKITKDFEKIVARLENDNKIKKDCP